MKKYKQHVYINQGKCIFISFIIITLVFSAVVPEITNADEQGISIEEAQEKLSEIEQRKKAIQQELERLKKEETDYQKSLENIQGLLGKAERELQIARSNYDIIVKQIQKMEEELEIEQGKLELQLIILKNRLKKYYKYNDMTYLSVLLHSQDFSQFLNRYRYLEKILENDANIVRQVKEQVEIVKSQRDSLQNKKEITKLLEQEIEKENENIKISIEAKNKYINKIEEEKKNHLAKLEELEKSSAQIKEIIDLAYREKEKAQQSQRQPEKVTPRAEVTLKPQKGIFQLPLKGSIISNFGKQKQEELNAYIFNSGIDISAPLGEAVRAASFGRVIYIGNIKGYGDIVILDHGGNVTTLYAHLSKVLIKINDQISKGQIIGQVGTSGGAKSPQLHFEVRVEGKPVDPFEWL